MDGADEYLKSWAFGVAEEFAAAINGEESTGARFERNVIAVFEGVPSNLSFFRRLPLGECAAGKLDVSAIGSPRRAGAKVRWSGAVLVDGMSTALTVLQ